MFKSFIVKILNAFSFLTAAEATVISFLVVSFLGAFALYHTEKNQSFRTYTPFHQEVTIQTTTPVHVHIREPEKQLHTFVSTEKEKGLSFIDAWFMAVSSLCVTGLTTVNPAEFSLSGKIIILLLVQMGGTGIILFTSFFAFLIIRGLSEQTNFHNMLSKLLKTKKLHVSKMIKYVLQYILIFEGLGFLVMGSYLQWFVPASQIDNINPWWWALFHSISAFNNSGMSLMSNNLMNFAKDPVIVFSVFILMFIGGLGYPVLITLHSFIRKRLKGQDKKQKELTHSAQEVVVSKVQTKIVLLGSTIFILLGLCVPLLIEWHNPLIQSKSIWEKVIIMFFQGTSVRSGGFNTIDIGRLSIATLFFYMMFMYIGSNPGGTAGGIKIPTVAVLVGYIKDWFEKSGEPVRLHNHVISRFSVSHAVRLFFSSIFFIAFMVFLLCVFEDNYLRTPDPIFNFSKILFELISAFGTSGFSMGFPGGLVSFSALLSPYSKIIITITMLAGRVGLLTLLAALPQKRRYANYPLTEDLKDAERIQIG